jgi:hypothetical protein
MLHLLPTFIELGFNNRNILEGVASWPNEELGKILEGWRKSAGLTCVEVQAIRLGLLAYHKSNI